ncbi:Chromatin structure-remodeling complex subunit rsc4-like protein [Elsinoe fawcettii]|nr:Chromatin structure-remodeling complex subunit rsc4-like protein [Elsinoe fawcettii]
MERGRKRKADIVENGDTPVKRQKTPASNSPEAVTELGAQFIESLKTAKDKTGRSISDMFLTLPDKRELPDYYEVIKLPIAIDTVERKLRKHGYSTLSEVEGDLKRMVNNAKQYNDDDSLIFADAERIRKMLHNWMKVNNPAYKDPDYIATATPVPGEKNGRRTNGNGSETPDAEVKEEEPKAKRPTITLSTKRRASEAQTSSATPTEKEKSAPTQADKVGTNEFQGKSFGQVQEAILDEFIQHRDEEELPIYQPFFNLPPRSLTDYFQLIKRPVCLKSLQKRARGQHGRETPTGITDFKTWDAFEDEVSLIWKNAQEYNEDGSDMFNLAEEFKEHFLSRLAEVKSKVEEPQSTRIKLNARPKQVLHLGAKPAPTAISSPGVTVDNEALERQRRLVQAGVNGQQTPQPPKADSQAPSDTRQTSTPPATVKIEKAVASPAPDLARVAGNGPDARASPRNSMPPPARVPSGSPFPVAAVPAAPTYTPSLAPQTATFGETFARTKPISEALLPDIHLASHPQLNSAKPFKLDIPASPDYTQQSVTVMLPATQYALQASPTVSQQLSSGRQYKLFVTANGVRVSPSIRPMVNGDLTNGVEKKQVYDISLMAGVNRIEVEIVAVTGRGGTLDVEKTTVFANLMRY